MGWGVLLIIFLLKYFGLKLNLIFWAVSAVAAGYLYLYCIIYIIILY